MNTVTLKITSATDIKDEIEAYWEYHNTTEKVNTNLNIVFEQEGEFQNLIIPSLDLKNLKGSFEGVLHIKGSAFYETDTTGNGWMMGRLEDLNFVIGSKKFRIPGYSDWEDVYEYEFGSKYGNIKGGHIKISGKYIKGSLDRLLISFIESHTNEFAKGMGRLNESYTYKRHFR